MEFDIISDSKIISQRFSHSLSGLEPMFNNFISQNLFFHGNSGLEIRESFLIPPFYHLKSFVDVRAITPDHFPASAATSNEIWNPALFDFRF